MANKWLAEDDTGGEYIFNANTDQYFSSLQQVGSVFNGGYSGLTWMKNVFCMARDFWHTSLGTPYSGQLFPHGGNPGTGQNFPN